MARTIYTRIVFDDSTESIVEPAKTDLWISGYRENGYESGELNPATIGSGTYPLFTTDGYHGYVQSGSAYPDEKTVTYDGNVLTFKFYGSNGGISSLTIILNGSYIFNQSLGYSSATCGALWFVHDDELEQINILWSCGGNFYGRHYTSDCGTIQSVANSAIIKSILDHFVIPIYNWRSVPSISGKNGTLPLSTINDSAINNGDPVTGAASDTFHSTEDSKIEELVTYATPIDSSKLESFTCVYQATPPFDALKLLVKKNSAPQDEEDADLVVNLPNPALSTGIDEYTATNLDPLTNYFCVVQVSDSGGHYKYSDPAEVRTGFMDRNFDYTGSIQTFTAPKTGIYQLETWGAQGGDATDGTLTARGGYGAYAVGEVLLQQGDTLYINVGGQNGYGGGGIEFYGDASYIVSGADSVLTRYSLYNRTFYKTTSGKCIRVCAYPSATQYTGPILMSTNPDDVKYYIMHNGTKYSSDGYSKMTVDGIEWYVSYFELWVEGNYNRNLNGNPEVDISEYPILGTYTTPTPEFYEALETLIRTIINDGHIYIA